MRRPVRVALALSAVAATAAAAVVVAPTLRSDPSPDEPLAELRSATSGALDVQRGPSGAVRSVGTEPGAPLQLSTTDPVAAADEFADRYGHLLGPGELVRSSATPRLDGGVALRFQQEVDGIPVFGGEASVQVDAGGGVLSTLADLSTDVTTAPGEVRVGADAAATEAVRSVASTHGLVADDLEATDAEQWWYDPTTIGAPSPFGPRLTWRTEVRDPSGFVRRLVLVDTATGTVDLDLDLVGDAASRRVCDFGGFPVEDPTCTNPTRVEGQGPTGNTEVDRAYDALGQWHAWFDDHFDWAGYDGLGGAADTASVRVCRTTEPCPYANAFWDGTQGVFGSGYAVDDVVAHEMTHGITQATAGLVFSYQSGAINESMSDVFGELIDQANGSDDTAANRWLIGEDLAAGPLRDMADPATYGDPATMTSPDYAAGPDDSGGAHTNSGVGNRAAALLVDGGSADGHTVRAIGARDTAALWFTVLTDVLTSGSDYADLTVALRDTCRGLIGLDGITATDCVQVDEAVAAVGMDDVPIQAPATEAPVCAAGQQPDELFADDFEDPSPPARWTVETTGGFAWQNPAPSFARYASHGEHNLWGADTGVPHNASPPRNTNFGDTRIALADAVPVTAGAPTYLRFRHAYAFEQSPSANLDGGLVEYSLDGGAWSALTSFTDNGYPGSVTGPVSSTNPLRGRAAFVGDSPGYLSSRADLSAFAGHQVRLRFRLGEDAEGGDLGWYIDEVSVYRCPPTGPQLAVTQSADEDRIVAGDVLHLNLTVTNTGTEPLTGLTVDTPEVPSCSGSIPDLDPGEHHDVECDHDTVDPDDIGTFTSTASADAAEVIGPIPAEPLAVTILDPGAAELEVTSSTEQDTVVVGEDIDLTVTLRNTGAVTLTGLDVGSPDIAGCDGPAGDLDPGGVRTVDCTHTTVDPGDIGTFTSTVSATSTEIVEPAVAAPVEVTVLAPDRELPTVTVATPVNGAVYNRGQVVLADYACADDSGFAECLGTVADGQALDTSTAGTKVFNVVTTDLAGQTPASTVRTYVVATRRADGRIRQGAAGPMVGDNVVNTSAARQFRTALVPRRGQVTFFITAQNDGSMAEQLRVKGQPGTINYAVRYLSAGHDITAAVRSGTYLTPSLAPGAVRTIKVVVTVGAHAPAGGQVNRLVTISSKNDPSRKDVVRFVVKRR